MSESEALDRLCHLVGLETSYWDLGGTLHEVPAQTKTALLAAMGHDTGSPARIQAAIHALETERWTICLEPVYVLPQAGAALCLSLCEQDQSGDLLWELEYENGGGASGSCCFSRLGELESRRIEGREYSRRLMPLPDDMPTGYHRFRLSGRNLGASSTIIITPPAACRPAIMDRRRLWGAAHQLYSLRSEQNWGIGDFSDLARLGRGVSAAGGALLGLNPLHALFLSAPERASPYAPSSRIFINPLYIDITAIPEYKNCPAAHQLISAQPLASRREEARQATLVDYQAILDIKIAVLRQVFAGFESGADKPRQADLARFTKAGGKKLCRFALYQALENHFKTPAHGWPSGFQDPCSHEVARFARQNDHEINFHIWLQWIAQGQLAGAGRCVQDQGMAIGLYGDLAVGVDAWGADAWDGNGAYVRGVEFGAPPDPFSVDGQNWGMPPLDPARLRAAAYQPFIDILRANMRHMGALRIDHVMWLQRMFWIPQGAKAVEGAYIRYPVDDLMGILALESQRHGCLVIGEDLGTVPEGFAEKMEAYGLLSYRLMRFERYPDGLFKRPSTYKANALAMFASHDLPPIAGYWQGRELDCLEALGRLEEDARPQRARDLEMLANALRDQQLWPDSENTGEIILAIHRFLARSSSVLMMVNMEDVAQTCEQVNVPGTFLECPNWRHRLDLDLEALCSRLRELGPALNREREAH